MKTSEAFKNTIEQYVISVADSNPQFAAKAVNPKKNLDDCVTFVLNQVQKSGVNGFTDDEIYSMVIHYYEEEDIDIGNPVECQVVVNHQVQLCCSNPDLPDFIIAQHLKSQNAASMVNIANNDDASAFCHCAECKKLDADRPGIPEWPHISDRYLFLANQVAEKAAKLSPPRKVHFLAYCETEEPPAKTRVAENIVVTFCPTDYRLERCLSQLDNWIRMGARQIRMRPNLPCYFFSVLPVGFEKHAWKLFSETLKRPEVVGCNIDNLAAANPWTFSFPMYGYCQIVFIL